MVRAQRVLIIEDEKLLLEAFDFLLTSEGYTVRTAKNGKVGLAELNKFKPDIILLDMLMPIMNGMDFLEASDIARVLPKCQVIVLSNLSDTVRLRDVVKYNVVKVILKANLAPKELVAEVRKLNGGV